MTSRAYVVLASWLVVVGAGGWLAVENAGLRRELAEIRAAHRAGEAVRPRMRLPVPPPRLRTVRPCSKPPASAVRTPGEESTISTDKLDAAVKARMEAMRQARQEARARRREAIGKLTPEEKEAQRTAFIDKMRARAQRRLKAFVEKTGLSAEQAASFETTVAALDASLREAAEVWAEQIRKSGSFNQDSRVKFMGDMTTILSSGYTQMDATLPETWRSDDGNVNLMQIVGGEAFSPVVDALTEQGLEDGLQAVGQLMGGPEGEGGPGESEGPGEGLGGAETAEGGPGTGDGPGSGPGGGPGGSPGF